MVRTIISTETLSREVFVLDRDIRRCQPETGKRNEFFNRFFADAHDESALVGEVLFPVARRRTSRDYRRAGYAVTRQDKATITRNLRGIFCEYNRLVR